MDIPIWKKQSMFPKQQTYLVIHHFSHLFLEKKLKNKHQQTKFQMVIPEKNRWDQSQLSMAWKTYHDWGMDSIMVMIWGFFLVVEPPTPLKNDGVKVSWDYCSQIYIYIYIYIYYMEKMKMFQTNQFLNALAHHLKPPTSFDEDALKNLDLFPHWNTLYICNTS